MAAEKIKVKVTVTKPCTREVEWEVDAAELTEWARVPVTARVIKDYFEAGPMEETDAMWDQGAEVAHWHEMVDIEKVEIL